MIRWLLGASLLLALLLVPHVADAQYSFCWLKYPHEGRAHQSGWRTDYPMAGRNLTMRFEELTTVHVKTFVDSANGEAKPMHLEVDVNDPNDDTMYRCPLLYTQDVGDMALTDIGVTRLRAYFAKGGILWIDDSWGLSAWEKFRHTIAVLAPEGTIIEAPYALMTALYALPAEVVQIVDIGTWKGGRAREQADSGPATLRVVVDQDDQPMLIIGWDVDLGDAWERERDPDYFEWSAVPGYGYGINILLYAHTH